MSGEGSIFADLIPYLVEVERVFPEESRFKNSHKIKREKRKGKEKEFINIKARLLS